MWFCPSFNLQFSILVKVIAKTLILDCAVLNSYGTLRLVRWAYWEWTFYTFRNSPMNLFLQPYPCIYKTLTLKTNYWLLQLYKPWCIWSSVRVTKFVLTLPWRWPLPYKNYSIDLQSKSMEWFLYDNDLRHERVNLVLHWS